MPFKKKNKVEEVAAKINKQEQKAEEEQQTEENSLLRLPEPERDYIYNMRIINELTALRAAIEELIKTVREE